MGSGGGSHAISNGGGGLRIEEAEEPASCRGVAQHSRQAWQLTDVRPALPWGKGAGGGERARVCLGSGTMTVLSLALARGIRRDQDGSVEHNRLDNVGI